MLRNAKVSRDFAMSVQVFHALMNVEVWRHIAASVEVFHSLGFDGVGKRFTTGKKCFTC